MSVITELLKELQSNPPDFTQFTHRVCTKAFTIHKFNHTMNRLHFTHYLTMHQFIIDNQIDKLEEYYIEREAINCGEWNLYWRN